MCEAGRLHTPAPASLQDACEEYEGFRAKLPLLQPHPDRRDRPRSVHSACLRRAGDRASGPRHRHRRGVRAHADGAGARRPRLERRLQRALRARAGVADSRPHHQALLHAVVVAGGANARVHSGHARHRGELAQGRAAAVHRQVLQPHADDALLHAGQHRARRAALGCCSRKAKQAAACSTCGARTSTPRWPTCKPRALPSSLGRTPSTRTTPAPSAPPANGMDGVLREPKRQHRRLGNAPKIVDGQAAGLNATTARPTAAGSRRRL